MKQEMSTNGSAGKPARADKKPTVNLYEPYSTPRLFYEVLRYLIIFVMSLIARVRLRGRYNIPRKGPYIIAANHLSWMDIPLIPAFIPGKVVYMAKEEAFYSKVGWLVRFLGAFPVKRHEADRQAIRAASEQLKAGKKFIIFPEGTRSTTRTMAKGFAGLGMIALRAGVPVLPVAIWGSENALKKLGAEITISYGKPILLKPKGPKITREDIDDTTEEIMRQIATMLPPQYRGVYADTVSPEA
ncbi:1-acyl-sn-glycerol-3-phosphate acyltransferase [Ktedonosporobacter rubrisoli]|uniref:1-acyl-sn-glycerol-3-phosphate acyltransferase n=1 Tax=Ktedonosporobacter rubrisoli TaxID=2509675 RepID=A0A4P6JWR0_KTERU|nr:lysophospholipid acyltransferase family protein [Ktedonosporobacter rubrisoli]QBD79466.1 1-acyl-sn-glycerol-3-phosphate acyltransferase [Ktedonosporobacter rubrisoli]